MVGIVVGLEVPEKWRKTEDTQRGRAENCAFEAMCGAVTQDFPWRPGGIRQVVGKAVEKTLHARRSFESAQLTRLSGCKFSSLFQWTRRERTVLEFATREYWDAAYAPWL